jgi:hypothetical protein
VLRLHPAQAKAVHGLCVKLRLARLLVFLAGRRASQEQAAVLAAEASLMAAVLTQDFAEAADRWRHRDC